MTPPSPRYALCIEETLGHRAHGLNLLEALSGSAGAQVDMIGIAPSPPRAGMRMPVPWALSGSIAALMALRRADPYDAVFFHTQTISLMAPLATRGAPYVVSVDATPLQIDRMGRWYEHQERAPLLEGAKRRWYRAVLNRAAGVVTWSDWALRSLREEYQVEPPRALVAHPGAGPGFFEAGRSRCQAPGRRPRILFVGGQFQRKGGDHLLEAYRAVADRADLVLVTEDDVPAAPPGALRRGIRPGTPELLAAFAQADIFCLPTLGDCTPVALGEAMAAGLPVVTTDIGSNAEWVPPTAGVLVPPGDASALADVLVRLVDDEPYRAALSAGARRHAERHMDARRNAGRILDLLGSVSEERAAAVTA